MTPSECLLSVCTAEPVGIVVLASRIDPAGQTGIEVWRERMPGLVRAGWVAKGQVKRVSVYSITAAGLKHLAWLRGRGEVAA